MKIQNQQKFVPHSPVLLDYENPAVDELILDGTKMAWHLDRVKAWEKGERVAPITIDIAITRSCNYGCHFCYAMTQENDRTVINREYIFNFFIIY